MFDWAYWLSQAHKGDAHAGRIALHQLATAVRENTLTETQREFLSAGLHLLLEAQTKKEVDAAVKTLRLGRPAGAKTKSHAEASAYERACAVRNALVVESRRRDITNPDILMDLACTEAVKEISGIDGASAPTLRKYRRDYEYWAPIFAAIESNERET